MKEDLYPDCPIRNILARFSDKWSLLILYTLSSNATMRYNALRHSIPDISQKMLTLSLRTLEEDGLVSRRIYAEVPRGWNIALPTGHAHFFPTSTLSSHGRKPT